MKKVFLAVILGLIVSLFNFSICIAQYKADKNEREWKGELRYLSGLVNVISVGGGYLLIADSIVSDLTKTKKVFFDKSTKFIKEEEEIEPGDIRVADKVKISYHLIRRGHFFKRNAATIEVESSK